MNTQTKTDTATDTDVIPSGGLAELEKLVQRDLEITAYPERNWILASEENADKDNLDVLIIGGGQSGLGVAFGLMRQRVHNILVIDENKQGREGPWLTFARMITLRTPKYLTGPDYGIPNLTFRAWYESQWGNKGWQTIRLIPKELWAQYLQWYRKVLSIPVQNEAKAGAIEWRADKQRFAVPVHTKDGGTRTIFARKVVLATGIDGSGRWDVPAIISDNLPAERYSHTRAEIDFAGLKGKRIAILGAGASAFDNASVALEAGVGEVRLFYRRKTLPNVNPYRWAEFVGFLNHHADLADDLKWRFVQKILRMGQLPPTDTFERATQFPHFHLHGGSDWKKVEYVNDEVKITTNDGVFTADFVIVGTGFVTDLSVRTELSGIFDKIALWKDRYTAPESERNEDLSRHPYLGPHFELQEKVPGSAPYLRSIFNYTFGCLPSLGFGGASISGMKYSLPRVVTGVTKQLYCDDGDLFFATLEQYDIKEF